MPGLEPSFLVMEEGAHHQGVPTSQLHHPTPSLRPAYCLVASTQSVLG